MPTQENPGMIDNPTNYIDVRVVGFTGVGGTNYWSRAKLSLDPHYTPRDIEHVKDKNGESWWVVTGPSTLEFTFVGDDDRGGSPFVPVGICFKEIDESDSDPLGLDDFPTWNIGKTEKGVRRMQVVVTDANPRKNLAWEFYIVIQRIKDGKLGVIDPKIRNQPPA
jgi:hypothetical protein